MGRLVVFGGGVAVVVFPGWLFLVVAFCHRCGVAPDG